MTKRKAQNGRRNTLQKTRYEEIFGILALSDELADFHSHRVESGNVTTILRIAGSGLPYLFLPRIKGSNVGGYRVRLLATFPMRMDTNRCHRNGTLREYLAPGLSREDFKRRLRLALDPPPVQAQASAPPAPHITNPAGDAPVSSPSGEAPRNTAQTAPLEPQTNDNEILRPSQSPRPPSRPTQDQPQAVAEPSPPQQTPSSLSENQKGKQRAVESEPAPPDARRAQHQKLRQQQLQREREQRQERQRILDQVKHDREELKYRQSFQNVSGQVHDEAPTKPQTHTTAPPSKDGTYRIQVRLFDGTSIRSTFTGHQTIRADVRSWLDTQRSDGNTPYTLKAILHPLPNKTLSISEEEEPLQDLGLGRTANLVMVPVKGYTEAYASSAPGLAYRGLSAGYNLVSGAAGAVYGALGTFLGVGQVTQNTTAQSQSTAAGGSEAPRTGQAGSGINIRTLRDQREGEGEHQLYNGNQVSSN